MELQVQPIQIPERILFNADELRQELRKTLERYKTVVYTPEQLKTAKADRASLNRLKKALNDERIKREREYMKPFEDFKEEINSLIAEIDKPLKLIDDQVKGFEEERKKRKHEEIKTLFESLNPHEWLTLDKIEKQEWLNASFGIKAVEAEIKAKLAGIADDLTALAQMPSFAFEASVVYKNTLDIKTALSEGARLAEIARLKAEAEAEEERKREQEPEEQPEVEPAAEEVPEIIEPEPEELEEQEEPEHPVADAGMWVSFRALLTVETATKLRRFFEENGIPFAPIKEEK